MSARKITPSGIGAYFHHQCPLQLQLSTKVDSGSKSPSKTAAVSPRTRAILDRGNRWESNLTELIASQKQLLDGSHMDIAELLTTVDPETYGGVLFVYHMRIHAPADLEKHLFDDPNIHFSSMEPDFLKLTKDASGTKIITIIDAKSSKELETSHQVQVSIYAIVLEAIIKELGIADAIVDPVGMIWRPQAPNLVDRPELKVEDTFSLEVTKPLAEDFLRHKLRNILATPEEEVNWHYSALCQGCPFQSRCEKRVVEEHTLSFIPNLSGSDHRFLKSLLPKDRKNRAGTLTDIEDLVAREPKYGDVDSLPPSHRQRLSRILRLQSDIGPSNKSLAESPVIQAVHTRAPVVIGKFSPLLPPTEECGIFISTHMDPLNGEIYAWAVAVTHGGGAEPASLTLKSLDAKQRSSQALGEELISHLADLLRSVEGKRVQCYTVDEKGRHDLVSLLVNCLCSTTSSAASASKGKDKVFAEAEVCLLALVDDANSLTTQVQPALLNLAESLTGLSSLSKGELEERLSQLQVSSPSKGAASGSQKLTKADIKAQLDEALAGILRGKLSPSSPPLLSVMRAVDDLVVLPVPAFLTLSDVAHHIAGMPFTAEISDEEICGEWLERSGANLKAMLTLRMESATRSVFGVRRLVEMHCRAQKQPLNAILIAEASIFQIPKPLAFQDGNLRKLAFMTQYEVVSRCNELKDARLNLRDDSGIVLKYTRFDSTDKLHVLEVVNGGDLIVPDSDRKELTSGRVITMNKWLMTELTTTPSKMKPYLMYPDTALFDCTTIPKVDLPLNLGFASIGEVVRDDMKTFVKISAEKTFKCSAGNYYLLQPRMVDTNMKKVLAVLHNLDVSRKTLFQQLLADPISWGEKSPFRDEAQKKEFVRESERMRSMYRELVKITDSVASLNMMKSQATVFTSIRDQRLELVWGPPGTGKTHFLALTILNLAAAAYKTGVPFRICVSAFTHSAIDNLLERVKSLLEVARGVKNEDRSEWRDLLRIVKLGEDSVKEPWKEPLVVVGATCWAVYRELLDGKPCAPVFDMMIVDEGSQVPVALGAILVSTLHQETGRLVVCGDHLQLAPILQMKYPSPAPSEPLLFRSFLQCLMRQRDGHHVKDTIAQAQTMSALPCMGMLRENHRMNAQLTNFSRRLYGSNFEFIKDRGRLFFKAEKATTPDMGRFLTRIMDARASMVTSVLKPFGVENVTESIISMSYERQIFLEARVVAELAKSILVATDWQEDDPTKRLFIVTPHRVQQAAITSALHGFPDAEGVKIDTVEKMQGLEAEVVIICYGFLDIERLKGEGDFLFDFHRINVAVTRARKLCIFVTSEAVLNPGFEIVCSPSRQEGFAHLVAFRESSQLEDTWPLNIS